MKFFRKKKKEATSSEQPSQQNQTPASKEERAGRIHNEGLGHVWQALTGMNPEILIPQVLGTILHSGGTRPPWKWKWKGQEYVALAWPQDQPVRACALLCGKEGGELRPVTVVPLLEGLPNNLSVDSVHPRNAGHGGDVASKMLADQNPMWFFDPFYTRDAYDLTPGITHTFWLAGLALGIRKAVLDDITLVQGPQYEAYAANWLENHPGAKSQDVPPLKLEIKGKHFIMPGNFFGEYKIRAIVEKLEDCQFEKMPVKICYLNFPFNERENMRLPLFASQFILGDYEPRTGDDIEAQIWLQGRIIDLEAPDSMRNNEVNA